MEGAMIRRRGFLGLALAAPLAPFLPRPDRAAQYAEMVRFVQSAPPALPLTLSDVAAVIDETNHRRSAALRLAIGRRI